MQKQFIFTKLLETEIEMASIVLQRRNLGVRAASSTKVQTKMLKTTYKMDLFPEGQWKMEGGKTRATLEDDLLLVAQNVQLVRGISLQQNQRCAEFHDY